MENFLNLKRITVLFPIVRKSFKVTFTFSFGGSVMTPAPACSDVFYLNLAI